MPRPADALLIPNLPCTETEKDGRGAVFDGALGVCAFGAPAARAAATVALVGDSHAMNWRAPLDVVARALGWRALGMARAHCPFSRATILLPARDRKGCRRWRRRVIAWFGRHPEVSVVFVAEYTSRSTPSPPARESRSSPLRRRAMRAPGARSRERCGTSS